MLMRAQTKIKIWPKPINLDFEYWDHGSKQAWYRRRLDRDLPTQRFNPESRLQLSIYWNILEWLESIPRIVMQCLVHDGPCRVCRHWYTGTLSEAFNENKCLMLKGCKNEAHGASNFRVMKQKSLTNACFKKIEKKLVLSCSLSQVR